MRTLYPSILAAILLTACGGNTPGSKAASNTASDPASNTASAPVLSDSARATSFVAHFVRWYARKYDSLDNFYPVNTHEEEDSAWNTLNWGQTGRYLHALRSSGFFTERFLAEKEAYFRHCDSFFNAKKEHNRSPTGFDFDLVLGSSQTDEFLADSVDPVIQLVNLSSVIFDKYLVFTLKCAGDTCRIDSIHYRIDPDKFTDAVYVPGADSSDPAIGEIRHEYLQIRDSLSKFRVARHDLPDQSTEGGEATLYYERDTLRRAVAEFFGETGKATIEYYFKHGKACFCIRRETRYTKPFYIKNYAIGMIKTIRYYFQNGRMIRCIDEKGKLVDKALYPEIQKDLSTADSVFLPAFSQ